MEVTSQGLVQLESFLLGELCDVMMKHSVDNISWDRDDKTVAETVLTTKESDYQPYEVAILKHFMHL